MKLKKVILLIVVIVAIFGLYQRSYILYRYYLWQSRGSGMGPLAYTESIIDLGPSVVPHLIKTLEDKESDWLSRRAATVAIVEIDEQRAETLFARFLDNGTDEQITEAILGLSDLHLSDSKRMKYYEKILPLAASPNKAIRAKVTLYLEDVPTDESKKALTKLLKDNDSFIKYRAKESLDNINKLQHQAK